MHRRRCNGQCHEDQLALRARGLPDNPCGKFALDLLNWDVLAAIQLVQSLSHRGDELDLPGDIMQRSIVGNALKQVLNNLFVAHVGSVHCESNFFKPIGKDLNYFSGRLSRAFTPRTAPAIMRFTAARESPPSSFSGIVANPMAEALG